MSPIVPDDFADAVDADTVDANSAASADRVDRDLRAPEPDNPIWPHAAQPKQSTQFAWQLAKRSWWFPWLLGAVVIAVGVATVLPLLNSSGDTNPASQLPTSTHTVLYQVTGSGASPEIRFVTDGVAASQTVNGANLPWSKQLTITVGPGLGVAQLLAVNNNTADNISCSVSIDGVVIYHTTSMGAGMAAGCSAVIRP
jgi:hypothetical protein